MSNRVGAVAVRRRNIWPTVAVVAGLAALALAASPLALGDEEDEPAEPVRNIAEWNLPKSQLAIEGYDPVAYFAEGGGKAVKGKKGHKLEHGGVTYYFKSDAHRELFKKNPDKYEPAHGIWCSYALADDGSKVGINPKAFIVKDGRLFLFYQALFGDAKKKWEQGDHDEQAAAADEQWKKISGESPRKPAAD